MATLFRTDAATELSAVLAQLMQVVEGKRETFTINGEGCTALMDHINELRSVSGRDPQRALWRLSGPDGEFVSYMDAAPDEDTVHLSRYTVRAACNELTRPELYRALHWFNLVKREASELTDYDNELMHKVVVMLRNRSRIT